MEYPPLITPGPIDQATADRLNEFLRRLGALLGSGGFTADPPLVVSQNDGGVNYRLNDDPWMILGLAELDTLGTPDWVPEANPRGVEGSTSGVPGTNTIVGWSYDAEAGTYHASGLIVDILNPLDIEIPADTWIGMFRDPRSGRYWAIPIWEYASNSEPGIVSNGAQHFSGAKTFETSATVWDNPAGGRNGLRVVFASVGGVEDVTKGLYVNVAGFAAPQAAASANRAVTFYLLGTSGATLGTGGFVLQYVQASNQNTLAVMSTSTGTAAFGVYDAAGTFNRGVSGTGGGGDTVVGGIITALAGGGSGPTLTINTTPISGGTTDGVLYVDGAGKLQNVAPSTSGQIFMSGSLVWVTMSGDATITSGGVLTIANNAVTTAKINNAAVTLAKIANAAASSKLVGSGASGSGAAYVEITLGTNLSMSGTTLNAASAGVPTVITVADTADTSCFVALFEDATGDLPPKTDAALTYNAGSGILTATLFSGPATQIQTADSSDAGTAWYLVMTANATGGNIPITDAGLRYNAVTNALTATTFVGALSGNATTATSAATLTTPRNIGGVAFDGSADIVPQTIESANEATDTTCFLLFVTGSGTVQLQPKNNTGLTYNSNTNAVGATTFVGALSGNATTATTLQTARNIGGVSFDGSADVVPQTITSANEATDTTCFLLFITASGTQSLQPKNNTGLTYNSSTNAVGATTFVGALSGNATTATTLATPRNIGGVAFDGSAAIVPQTIESANEATDTTCFPLFITASGTQQLQPKNNTSLTFNSNTGALGATSFVGNTAASTITGTTLASNVVTTSITTVGTLVGGATGAGFTVALDTSTFTGTLSVTNGGTNANLSGTGGTAQVLKQASTGADVTVGVLGSTEIPQRHNLLLNSGAWFWTRQATPGTLTTYADDAYYADRWYVLTQTGTIQCNRTTGNVGIYALDLKQTQAVAQRMGTAQILENQDSHPFRSRAVRLQFYAKCSTTTTLRYAILEWTSTADSVTSDVVNDWTSSTYTASNFFIANITVVNTGTTTTSVGTGYTLCEATGTVSSSCNNLIVMVWTDGTVAQNVTMELADLQLCASNLARDWLPDPIADEECKCRRFAIGFSGQHIGLAQGASVTYNEGNFLFSPSMRATPTLASSPAAAYTANTGSAGTVAVQNGWVGGISFFNSGANWTTNAIIRVTAVLEAEL